jgi:peroxiredoxin
MKTVCRQRRLSWRYMFLGGAVALALVLAPMGVAQLGVSFQAARFGPMFAEALLKVPAKDFELKDLNGSTVRLSDYRGKKPVLLYFWASWCPGCIAVKPQLAKLLSAVGPDRMEVLAINVGGADSLERIMQYQKGHPEPYSILYDGAGKVSRAYQVMGIPLFIMIDKEGSVIYRNNQLPRDIEKYLGSQ